MTGLPSHLLPFTLSVTLLALVGCGATPATPPVPAPVPVTGASVPATPLAGSLLDRVNEVRARGAVCRGVKLPPAPPVTYNARLEQAAQLHADDMASRNYFSHTSPEGRTLGDRLVKSGYAPGFVALENLAAGYATAAEVVDAWLSSREGHCEALLDGDMREMGVGFREAGGNTYANYWVLNLAVQQ